MADSWQKFKMNLQNEVFTWSLSIRTRSEPRFKASVSARMDIASRVRRLAETIALANWMQDLRTENRVSAKSQSMQGGQYEQGCHQEEQTHPCRRTAKTLWDGISSIGLFAPVQCPNLWAIPRGWIIQEEKEETQKRALAFDASYKPFKQQKNERRTIGSHLRHSWEIGAESRWTFCASKRTQEQKPFLQVMT